MTTTAQVGLAIFIAGIALLTIALAIAAIVANKPDSTPDSKRNQPPE